MKEPNPRQRLKTIVLESRQVYERRTYKLTYLMGGLLRWFPTFLFYTPQDVQPGVCCGITSMPAIFDKNKVFGKYEAESVYPLGGMQMKQTGKQSANT